MNCRDIDALLAKCGAGTKNAARRAEVASHLAGCRRCADAWYGHEALAGERPPAPRADFYAAAMAAATAGTAATSPRARTAARPLGPALGLAAAAVVALTLAWFWLPDDTTSEAGPTLAADSAGASGGASAAASAGASTGASAGRDSAVSSRPGVLGDTPRFELSIPGYIAGIHYRELATPAPTAAADGQIEVCEFFMFGCVHCYNFEATLTAFAESRAETIDLVRVPALFSDLARLHAQAFYTAEALGVLDAMTGPFYAEIHERGRALATVPEIRELFVRQGVDGASFDTTFASAPVLAQLRRAEELNRLYRVDSTPSLGVNGRYLTNASLTGSNEKMLELVDALVTAEAAAAVPCEAEDEPCIIRRFQQPARAPTRDFR